MLISSELMKQPLSTSDYRDKPIPDKAMPVVELLRSHVPRPKLTDLVDDCPWLLRFKKEKNGSHCCPMGLVDWTQQAIPVCSKDFGEMASDEAVYHFFTWWDAQHNGEWAINQVWGQSEIKGD